MKRTKEPEIYRKIRDYVTDYLPSIRKRSTNTVIAHKNSIKCYLKFLTEKKLVSLLEITFSHFHASYLKEFLLWLQNDLYQKPVSINLRLSNIRSFCEFLYSRDYISMVEHSEILEIQQVKDSKNKRIEYLSLEEMQHLISLPNENKHFELMDKFYMCLLYESACRNQEILDLKIKDVEITKTDTINLHVVGKGGKYRCVPLQSNILSLFSLYIKEFNKVSTTEDFLLYTPSGSVKRRMSDDNGKRIIEKYEPLLRGKFPACSHIHPHIFRHSRAMHLYEAGVPLPIISDILGHYNIETTIKFYAQSTLEMKRKETEKLKDSLSFLFEEEEFKFGNDLKSIEKMCGLS